MLSSTSSASVTTLSRVGGSALRPNICAIRPVRAVSAHKTKTGANAGAGGGPRAPAHLGEGALQSLLVILHRRVLELLPVCLGLLQRRTRRSPPPVPAPGPRSSLSHIARGLPPPPPALTVPTPSPRPMEACATSPRTEAGAAVGGCLRRARRLRGLPCLGFSSSLLGMMHLQEGGGVGDRGNLGGR